MSDKSRLILWASVLAFAVVVGIAVSRLGSGADPVQSAAATDVQPVPVTPCAPDCGKE